MMTKTISFKYQLEKAAPRSGPGGITRGASVREFPASTGLAGVSMWLEPGAMRELHWHANAAEWAYVLEGNMRTTIVHPDGNTYVDLFQAGDVWYFPKGYGHVLQCVGPEKCHFILMFDNGDFSEDHTFSITDFISSVPENIAAQNLGITIAEVAQLPHGEVYFAKSAIPDPLFGVALQRNDSNLLSPHRYPLSAQQPKLVPGGGMQRLVTQKEFPISTTITGSLLEIAPGGLRELHWHPNADEWQYYIQGTAEMGVFLAEGTFINDRFEAGDIGYVPMGAGHYIKNVGTDVLKMLIGFNSGQYASIDLSMWLSGNPPDLLAGNFSADPQLINKFPRNTEFIIKGRDEK